MLRVDVSSKGARKKRRHEAGRPLRWDNGDDLVPVAVSLDTLKMEAKGIHLEHPGSWLEWSIIVEHDQVY